MAVPKFEEFLYPFLSYIKDKSGPVSTDEMKLAMITHFGLSEEDCLLKTKGGVKTQLADRLNWTRQYLRRALFVDIPQRGMYKITERGQEYLENHSSLRRRDLMAYQEFVDFINGNTDEIDENDNNDGDEANPVIQSLDDEIQSLTPTELLESSFNEIRRDLHEEILQKILSLTPRTFEYLAVDFLKKMGYGINIEDSAKVTQYSRDGGIDGIIYEDKLGLDRIYIQAKHYGPEETIGIELVQRFAGALDGKKASKGVFITTANFTKPARDFVSSISHKIVLINGIDLAKYMIDHNVGVSVAKTYEIKKVDLDYFDELEQQ